MRCPTPGCGYGWLKLPGLKMRPCANCGATLIEAPRYTALKRARREARVQS